MTATKERAGSDEYLKLVRRFPLRPIRTEAEHDEAVKVLGGLMAKKKTKAESDYADVLFDLVKKYDERDPFVVPPVSPLEALKTLMEFNDMTINDLAQVLGSQPAASRVLNGRRLLSKAHVRKLAARFKVSADLFL